MLSDIDISRQAPMKPLSEIVKGFDIEDAELYPYGKYIAKLELSFLERMRNVPDGQLVLVTAITPTPAGEGKSTTLIGLVDSLNAIGVKTVGAMREPSLGPVFGVKGGAAGGGYAQVNPMSDLNLHFTGDIHAITTANNLVSAVIDNSIYFDNPLQIDPERITWQRCLDLNDRALRQVEVGLSSKKETPRRERFNISVASDVMAIFCLATSIEDLRNRLDRAIVAYTYDNKPVTIGDLGITGSLVVLLKDALRPNLVQTLENNLMIVHGGPFANIAHGCNSILATQAALKLGDFVITEAGFGSDLGAEKFLDIKCQVANFKVGAIVLVATIRALKYHGGQPRKQLETPNLEALQLGLANLTHHYYNLKQFERPIVVAVNRFETDSEEEVALLKQWAKEHGANLVESNVFTQGSQGGFELARTVAKVSKPALVKPIYQRRDQVIDKIEAIAKRVYGAASVKFSELARKQLHELEQSPYRDYYICMAKTPLSITDDAKQLNAPQDFEITINEIKISSGAEFIICLLGSIMTMPGLNRDPLARHIDLDDLGDIHGLM